MKLTLTAGSVQFVLDRDVGVTVAAATLPALRIRFTADLIAQSRFFIRLFAILSAE
jgi:hypothetical protein